MGRAVHRARRGGISTNQILIGVGLIVIPAVGSQVLASRLSIPAPIVLLPPAAIPSDGTVPRGYDMLFVVDRSSRLAPATEKAMPRPGPGDMLVPLVRDEP